MLKKKASHACSNHPDAVSVTYCNLCKKFFCQACERAHNGASDTDHKTVPAESVLSDSDAQYKTCPLHSGSTFDSLCKDCLELCCLKCKEEGPHKCHDVLPLSGVKVFLKERLSERVGAFEEESRALKRIPEKVESELKKARTTREQAVEAVRRRFENVRKALDSKEAEFIKCIEDDAANDKEASKLVSNVQALLGSVSAASEAGMALISELDTNEITLEIVCRVMSLIKKENNVSVLQESVKSVCSQEASFDISEFEEEMKRPVRAINSLKRSVSKRSCHEGPSKVAVKDVGPFFASLEWNKNDLDEGYVVIIKKKGEAWDLSSSMSCAENACTVTSLEPGTTYRICVQAKRGTTYTRWSSMLTVKTLPFTVETVVKTMKEHYGNVRISLGALRLMEILIKYDFNKILASEKGGIEATVKAMESSIDSTDLCLVGCNVLISMMAHNTENQARAGAANAIETMIKLINSHINNPSLCELGLIALWNMTFNTESQSRAVEAGGIETILKAIDTHITNSDVCEQGCGALWNLTLIRSLFSCSCLCEMCSSSDDNKKKAAAAGGIGLVIRAMEIHITTPSVCEQGCGVLWNMSVNNPDNQELAGNIGGIEIILKVMNDHIVSSNVCKQGCIAITVLIANVRNLMRASNARAVEIVVKVLNAHPANADVAQQGCRALTHLAFIENNKSIILGASGIKAVIRAMEMHLNNINVCYAGFIALNSIMTNDNGNVIIESTCGIDVVIKAIDNHVINPNICECGCRTLWCMAVSVESQMKAGEAGGIETMVKVIETHIDNYKICKQGCMAIMIMAVSVENREKAGNVGAIDVVVKTINAHIDNADVCEKGCGALNNMVLNSGNQAKAGEIGGIETVLKAMNTHLYNNKLCVNGCCALWNMTSKDKNKARALACNGIETVIKVLNYHIDNINICKIGFGAFTNMIFDSESSARAKSFGLNTLLEFVLNVHPSLMDAARTILEKIKKF